MRMLKCEIRKTEERLVELFAERRQFSEHLIKWEDRLLPDKYDHNYFEYSGQPTKEEFAEAVTYQKNNGDRFRKRYAATSLIAQIRQSYPEAVLFLHADEDDTPKKMYEKMGFEAIDRLYEYMCLW